MTDHLIMYSTIKEPRVFFQKKEPIVLLDELEDYKEPGIFDPTMKMSSKNSRAVNIYPDIEYQTILGFGGAMTEASAVNLNKMEQATEQEILKKYFTPDDGIGYKFCRVSINSSDFSEKPYDYVEDNDDSLRSFSLERDRNTVFKEIKKARQLTGELLEVIATPWSPPAWMKTNQCRTGGGKLKAKYRQVWADYYVKYIKEARKEGIPVTIISIQNEPLAVVSWDSCIYSGEDERDFLKNFLGPTLEREGLSDIKILIWDHNKDKMVSRVKTIMEDKDAAKYVWGAAFHWYAGDHFEALDIVHQLYPNLMLLYTEGCNGGAYRKTGKWCAGEILAHEIIGDLNHWTSACIDWNMVLDKRGGPSYAKNYCDSPVIYDTDSHTYSLESSYYYMGHFSKYVKPGAKRIAHSVFSERLDVCAFKNPDRQLAIVIMNREDTPMNLCLRYSGQIAFFEIEAHSINTLTEGAC